MSMGANIKLIWAQSNTNTNPNLLIKIIDKNYIYKKKKKD